MPSKKRTLLLRPPAEITNTILWLAQEKKVDINKIASDLLKVGINRLGIQMRTEPPPTVTNETDNSVSQVAGD